MMFDEAVTLYLPTELTDIRYQGVPGENPEPVYYWTRISLRTTLEEQETLRNGVRRFRTDGFLYFQLFAPVIRDKAQADLDLVGEYLRNSCRRCEIQGAPHLEFTSAEIVDNIAPDPAWLRSNIVAGFSYRQFL